MNLTKQIRLGYLPLDNRPVNLQQVLVAMKSANIKILHPPKKLLGNRNKPGEIPKISNWLENNFNKVKGWVISIDMLAYGGLLASRNVKKTFLEIETDLEILKTLKKQYPKILIFAFNVIKRCSITVNKTSDLELWEKYHNNPELLAEDRLINHLINVYAIKLTKEKTIDFLTLAQEDCIKNSLIFNEQQELKNQITQTKTQSKIVLTTGTDEQGLVLLTKLWQKFIKGLPKKIEIIFSNANSAKITSLYEDRSIKKSLQGQMKILNLKEIKKTNQKPDFTLMIWCPLKKQKDLIFTKKFTNNNNNINEFCNKIINQLSLGKKVILADLKYANGADPELMAVLAKKINLTNLTGFSAWNTSANTLGFALIQGILNFKNQDFLKLRLTDDWHYQSIIRPKLITEAKKMDLDIWALPDYLPLNEKIKFPWKRLFEAEIKA